MILYCHCGHRLHTEPCRECDCPALIGPDEIAEFVARYREARQQ